MDVKDRKPVETVQLTRLVNAPRERVWQAWADPQQFVQWFAPKPFQLIIRKLDFRVGGKFDMAMRGPDGSDFPFTGTYREITPPAKIYWSGEFPGGPQDQISTVVTFQEQGGKTKLTDKSVYQSVEDRDGMLESGMESGAAETMDRLEELLALTS